MCWCKNIKKEFVYLWNGQTIACWQHFYPIANLSRLIAASTALVTHQDVEIAFNTASNAIDNNFLILASYGIATAATAYSAYSAYNTFQKDGAEAALKQLGIEVVINTAAGVGMSAAFKCGKTVFPSIKSALGALFDATPGLKTAFGSFAEQLVVSVEKLAETYVGKQAAKLAKNVAHVEAKLVSAEEKILQKVSAKFNSYKDGLVKKVMPGNAASKAEKNLAKNAKEVGEDAASLVEKEVALVKPVEKVKNQLTESQQLLQNYAREFLDQEQIEILNSMYGQHAKINGKSLKLDCEHVFGMNVKWTKRGKPEIGGFHHDPDGVVVKSGLFDFKNKVVHESGAWKADVFYNGDFVKEIGFFPSDWSREKVVNKIFEAYNNAVKKGIEFKLNDQGKYFIESFTNEGIEVVMHITQKGHIKTVYPVIKQKGL